VLDALDGPREHAAVLTEARATVKRPSSPRRNQLTKNTFGIWIVGVLADVDPVLK